MLRKLVPWLRRFTTPSLKTPRKRRPVRRSARLGVEVLETRDLPDGTVLAHEVYNLVPESYQVSVEVTVSADVPGYEGLYRWQYHVTSGTAVPPGVPLYFNLLFGAGADVANVTGPEGWAGSVSASGVFWEGTSGSEPAPSGDFSFTTDPREWVLIEAGAGVAGFVSLSGELLGPGENASGENPYQDYLAAVQAANTAYIATVEQIVIDGNSDINAASQEAQDALDTAYAVYAAAVDDAQAAYDAAFDAALQAWVDAFDGAESAHSSASFAAWTAYEQAVAAALQARLDAEQAALADYDSVVADANAAYNDGVAAAQAAVDAAQAAYDADPENPDLWQALQDAQASYDSTVATETAVLQAAIAAADADYQAALDAAAVVYDQAVANAQDDLDAAIANADQAFADAQDQADSDYTAAEAPAWDTLVAAEAAAWQAYLDAKAAIEAALTEAVSRIQADGQAAIEAALIEWEAAEASAWDTYLDTLAQDPCNPAPQERITAPPEVALQWGEGTPPQDPGPRRAGEGAEGTPDYPVIDDDPGDPAPPPAADSFTSIEELKTELSKYAPAKELLEAAVKAGVKIVKDETTFSAGELDLMNKTILINPKKTSDTNPAASVLLYELLRWKYSKEQTDLDAKAMAGQLSKTAYAVLSEELSYKYVKEHHEIAAAAVTASKWNESADRFKTRLATGGAWETFDKYLDFMIASGHYGQFEKRYDRLPKKKP